MLHQSLVFFGTEFSTIVFNTFSVTLIKCKAAISKFSALLVTSRKVIMQNMT